MTPSTGPERLLAGLDSPRPPSGLRDRTLAAARAAGARPAVPTGIWTRIWSSPTLRLAWAVTVAALLLAHTVLWLHRPGVQPERLSPGPFLVAGPTVDAELAEILDLGRLRADAIPDLDPDSTRRHTDA